MREAEHKDHIKIWQRFFGTELPDIEELKKAVAQTLELPWIKKLLVFSHQAIVVLEMHSQKYVYVSPSIKNILGYEPEEVTDFGMLFSSMSPSEAAITVKISEFFITCLSNNKFTPAEILALRSTRNMWIPRKDGSLANTLQQGFVTLVNAQGIPILQMILATDITSFNSKQEHFYSLTVTRDNGAEELLLSGRVESSDPLISSREQKILKLISAGHSSKAIAEHLHISIETIKTHRKHLLEKTSSKNSIDLVRYGYAHGWL